MESSLPTAGTSTPANAVVGVGGTVATSTVNTAVVAIPSLSSINPKLQSQLASLQTSPSAVSPVTQQPKQTIGIVSMTNPTNVQVQGQTQQSTTLQQALASGRGGIVNFPGASTLTLADGQQQQASLNEVLAAAAGLRFQSNAASGGTPVVLNQNLIQAGQQQGTKQTAFIQDSGNGTTRLVLQQPQQTLHHATQGGSIQVQSQQGTQGNPGIGPGQILLGSSAAAVLKLAGNIRLGEGLRLAQLRLPSGAPGQQQCGTTQLNAAAGSSPLRLPQHRILLARGTLPGQSQTQGVLLGQTSTGQTVILSAGPAGSNPLAGLQQALAAGGSGSSTGQIALHAAPPQQQTIQLDSSSTGTTQQLNQQAQQQNTLLQQTLQNFVNNPNNNTVVTTASQPKFGLMANVAQSGNGSHLTVSSGASSSPIMQGSYSTATIQQTSSTPTLPPTSISLPASFRTPSVSNGSKNIQSPPNVTVTSSQHPPSQQQQLLFTSGATTGTGPQAIQTSSSTTQQITTLGMSSVQLQSALQQSQQNIILQQPQQTISQQGSQQTQGHHQLTAPIIIRSSQGDFVSFGIPSHLSLSRGVQGIIIVVLILCSETNMQLI